MRMNGADAILRSLEAEGVDVVFGLPGRRDPPDLRRVRARHDDSPRARPARAGRGAHGRGLCPRVRPRRRRDRDVGARRDEPRHPDRRRVDGLDAARLHHRPGALAPDRHRRVPGVRHHRHHHPGGQALVARLGRRGDPARDQGGVPRRAHGPLRPGARRHPARHPGGRARVRVPERGRPARLAPAAARPPAPDSRRRHRYRGGTAPDPLRRRRRAERRRLRGAARARRGRPSPRRHHADGEGRLPREPRPPFRLARHARPEVVELRAEQGRRRRRRRRPLRRPRHGQALRVRARRDDRPPGHRRRRDRQAPPRRRARGRAAQGGARRARGRAGRAAPRRRDRRVAQRDRRLARAVPAALRQWRRHAQAPGRARGAPGAHRRLRRGLDDRRRPASDVGDAVPRVRSPALLHHLGRARDDGLRHPRRHRRQGRAARTRRSSASTATAASR